MVGLVTQAIQALEHQVGLVTRDGQVFLVLVAGLVIRV